MHNFLLNGPREIVISSLFNEWNTLLNFIYFGVSGHQVISFAIQSRIFSE